MIIDDEVLKTIEECEELAPLHNPPNVIGIKACNEILHGVPQVAVFDTAFHQTMPKKHISMRFHMSIMRSISYVNTVSTARPTNMFQNVQLFF